MFYIVNLIKMWITTPSGWVEQPNKAADKECPISTASVSTSEGLKDVFTSDGIKKFIEQFVNYEEAVVDGFEWRKVSLDLDWKKFDFFVGYYDEENDRLGEIDNESLYSVEEIAEILNFIRDYMKKCGKNIDENIDYAKDLSWKETKIQFCEAWSLLMWIFTSWLNTIRHTYLLKNNNVINWNQTWVDPETWEIAIGTHFQGSKAFWDYAITPLLKI